MWLLVKLAFFVLEWTRELQPNVIDAAFKIRYDGTLLIVIQEHYFSETCNPRTSVPHTYDTETCALLITNTLQMTSLFFFVYRSSSSQS